MTLALATHSIRDRASLWTAELTPPPSFDIKSYQEKLNQIAGFAQQGEPVLRLVWGGNSTVVKKVGLEEIQVPRHAFAKRGERIPVRRWIIEENTDAGQLEAMGGKNHGNLQYQERGLYTPYIIIADHSKCHDCKAADFKCFGDYKHPGYEELHFLVEVTYKLLTSKQDPRKELDLDLVAEMVKAEKPNKEELEQKDSEEERKRIREWLKTHKTLKFDYGNSNSKSTDPV